MKIRKTFMTALIAVFASLGLLVPATSAFAGPSSVTSVDGTGFSTSHLRGVVWPAWQNPPLAVTNSAIENETASLGTKLVRISVTDCLAGDTCGTDNHAGTYSAANLKTTIQNAASHGYIPLLQLPPITRGAIGQLPDGSVNCPPASNFGANVTIDKHILDAIAAVYKGQIAIQADGNEPEYTCSGRWGSGSAGSAATSTDIGKFWAATGPAITSYAKGLGFSSVKTVGYQGLNGGTSWGSTATACSTCYDGYSWKINKTVMDNFNNAVKAAGKSPPAIEAIDSYCHSNDFSTSPGAPAPFTFNSNVCYSFQRQYIKTWHTEMNNIWGSTVGNTMELADVEWQGGICDSSSNCWSGYTDGSSEGNYVSAYLNMLKGDGVLAGAGHTGYALAALFVDAGNGKPSSPTTPSPGQYDVIYPDGTTPYWYASVKSAFAAVPAVRTAHLTSAHSAGTARQRHHARKNRKLIDSELLRDGQCGYIRLTNANWEYVNSNGSGHQLTIGNQSSQWCVSRLNTFWAKLHHRVNGLSSSEVIDNDLQTGAMIQDQNSSGDLGQEHDMYGPGYADWTDNAGGQVYVFNDVDGKNLWAADGGGPNGSWSNWYFDCAENC